MRSGFEANGCASARLFALIATISGGKRHPSDGVTVSSVTLPPVCL
jgi:hypothetical protein